MSQLKNVLGDFTGRTINLVGDTSQVRNITGSNTFIFDRTAKMELRVFVPGAFFARKDLTGAPSMAIPNTKIVNATVTDPGTSIFTSFNGRMVIAMAKGNWFLFDYSSTTIYVAKDQGLGDNPLQTNEWYQVSDGVDVNSPFDTYVRKITMDELFVINDIHLNIPAGYNGTFKVIDRRGSFLVGNNKLTSTSFPILSSEYELSLNVAGLYMEMYVGNGMCSIVNYGGIPTSSLE